MSRSSYLIAGVLVLGAGGWLASGMLLEEQPEPAANRQAEPRAPLVEVTQSQARPVGVHVRARGDVRAFRNAAARTQSEGRVAEILVSQGDRVDEGDPLIRLSVEGRDSRLREARAILDRRQQDYDAAAQLLQNGHTTAARVRELETLLQSAREEVQRLQEEIADTTVTAPYPGVVDLVAVEPGEYVSANTDVVTVIDNAPLRTVVRVNQQDVARVEVGRDVEVSYATGRRETGRVCFVSAAADMETRTFRVEVRSPNAQGAIPSGISAEVRIPTDEVSAHFVSPANLSLGTDGALGLKTVDEAGTVSFHAIEVVRAQTNGVWVSGLPDEARVITVGQGFVQAGDAVRVSQTEADGPVGDSPDPGSDVVLDGAGVPDDICEREPSVQQVDRLAAADLPVESTGSVASPPEGSEPSELSGADAVAVAQETLNARGFEVGPVDGRMGERTRSALRDFQEQNGLPATGDLDQATLDQLVGGDGASAQAGAQP